MNTQSDPPAEAIGISTHNPLQERIEELEFIATIKDLRYEKLKVWSGDVGEVWFYPNEEFHLSNVRATRINQLDELPRR